MVEGWKKLTFAAYGCVPGAEAEDNQYRIQERD